MREASDADIAQIRTLMHAVGYTREALVERTGSGILDDRPPAAETISTAPADGLDVVIRLFWFGVPVAQQSVAHLLGQSGEELLERLGFIAADPASKSYRAMVALYPVGELYIVSDQLQSVIGDDAPDDVVYPALTGSTVEFLAALPSTACDSLLDLGCGTGVAALAAAAGYARHVWAIDIADRATQFTRYNAYLNGITNITVARGDVYEPVARQTFDRIVAHPPFMPKLQSRQIFADGGDDGERITTRVVGGLIEHLRPGGRLYCRCLGTDRQGAPFERRVREMLGPSADDFDVVVLARKTMAAREFYCQLLARADMTAVAYTDQMQMFAQLGVENMVLCTIVIERHTAVLPPLDIRRELAPGTKPDPRLADWLLEWERAALNVDDDTLQKRKPTVSPHAEIRLAHHMDAGQLRAHGCNVTTRFPFRFSMESSPGLALLLGRCDGSHTVGELLDELKQLGALPANTVVHEYLYLVRQLIAGGVLELSEHRLPHPN